MDSSEGLYRADIREEKLKYRCASAYFVKIGGNVDGGSKSCPYPYSHPLEIGDLPGHSLRFRTLEMSVASTLPNELIPMPDADHSYTQQQVIVDHEVGSFSASFDPDERLS